MSPVNGWQFDTDMLIHRNDLDGAVASGARAIEAELGPVSIAGFSKVEFKGNEVQSLVLLRNKVKGSDDFSSAVSRIRNTGGRKAALMLSEFLRFLGGTSLAVNPWPPLQSKLLVVIEGQILALWHEISSFDTFDGLNCTRAKEKPRLTLTGECDVQIPKCTKTNVSCDIDGFLDSHRVRLESLRQHLRTMPTDLLTDELERVGKAIDEALAGGLAWGGSRCRSIGDLLIGLEATKAKGLVTSNYKEHTQLSAALGYRLKLFPIADVRRKLVCGSF